MTPAEEVKSRLDIVDVINEYIQLRPAGVNWKACCPFHEEKSPSFMVSKPKQIWHCFGCGEGGDMFTFVQKQEGVEFLDALRLLAQKAGVQVQMESPTRRSEREQIGKVLSESVHFWEEQLWKSEAAKDAREYLQNERDILPDAVRSWHLGYAPDSWDSLVVHLAKLGYTDDEMVKAGIAAKKSNNSGRGVYDRFRNRIIFPLTNAHGQVVGCTGRAMPGTDEQAKYVNTPETLVYKKGEILYGLDRAKTAIRQQGLAVIVEGNVDVITSHQAKVENVVAASGTALTAKQVGLLKRFTERVAFALDSDAAGEGATLRGIAAVLDQGLSVLLVDLPKKPDGTRYKDPDECIADNPDLWVKAVKHAEPLFDFYLRRAASELDLTQLADKQQVVKSLVPLMARVPDPVVQSHYITKLANLVQVPESQLRDLMAKSGVPAAPATKKRQGGATVAVPKEQDELLSGHLLAAMIHDPSLMNGVVDEVTPEMLSVKMAPLYKEMVVFYTEHASQGEVSWHEGAFSGHVAEHTQASQLLETFDLLTLLAAKEFGELAPEDIRHDILQISRRLKKRHVEQTLRKLEQQLRAAEAAQNSDEVDRLVREFQSISTELTKLS